MATSPGVSARTRMCHYEVLGLEMDCDVDAIRKSYKRAALQWHPDKNMDQIDVATEKFRLISEAYQVLSDPKERSWYDTHRESILRGGDGTAQQGMDDSYFVPDLWKFFTPTRTSEDFYRQFQQAFDEIIEAERADLERQRDDDDGKGKSNKNNASNIDYPTFGMSQTSFDEVKRFYSFWENFSSKMSFSWKDKYDTRETENRFQRRHVEKLNETERTHHRKEYNNLVRSLAAYCQKRDERYLQGMRELEAKQQEKRDKQLAWDRERKEAKQRQKEEIARMRYEEAQAEQALRGDEEMEEGEEEEEVMVRSVWNCGVCSKEFKSEKQLHNHEGSKKHKDAVKQFLKKGGSLPSKHDEDDLVELVEQMHIIEEDVEAETVVEEEVEKDEAETVVEEEVEKDGSEESAEEEVEKDGSEESAEEEDEEEESAQASNKSSAGKKIGKAKLKRLAKQKKAETAAKAKANKASLAASDDVVHACGLCFEEFPSKTKLFEHIKQMDHALPLDEVNKKAPKSSKRKQGK